MRLLPLLLIGLILPAIFFSAGCIQSQKTNSVSTIVPTSTASPVSTSSGTTAAEATPSVIFTYSPTPGPVDQVPDDQSVAIQVNRNPISENPTINVIYNGGQSLGEVNEMDVTVIRSDGTIENRAVFTPIMGSSVTLKGTTGTDRVIVWVTMLSGQTYEIYDAYSSYEGLN